MEVVGSDLHELLHRVDEHVIHLVHPRHLHILHPTTDIGGTIVMSMMTM